MKKLLHIILIALILTPSIFANQQQIDELGIEAELAIEDQNWSEADRVLTKLKNIGAELGIKELYTHLKIMEQLEQYGRILEEIDGVIASIDRDNKLYKPLLKLKIVCKKHKGKQDLIIQKQEEEIKKKKQIEWEIKNREFEKQRKIDDLKNTKSSLVNHLLNRKTKVIFFHMPAFMHSMKYSFSINEFYIGDLKKGNYFSMDIPSGPIVFSIGTHFDAITVDLTEGQTHYITVLKNQGLREVSQGEFDKYKRKLKDQGEKRLPPGFIEKRQDYLNSLALSNHHGTAKLSDDSLEGNYAHLKIVHGRGYLVGFAKLFIDDIYFGFLPRGHKLECILPLGTSVKLSNGLSETFTVSEPGDHYFKFWRSEYKLMNSHDKGEYDRWARKAKFMRTIDYVKFKKGIAGN